MILDPSGGTNENIDTPFEILGLAIDADTSVDCHNLKLVGMMLQLGKLSSDLNRKFSGGCQNNCLNPLCSEKIVFTQIFDCG
jgi:hypothetical protein